MANSGERPDKTSRLRQRAEEMLRQRPDVESEAGADMIELIHELDIHQAELEIQNEELRRAQGEISALHREFEDLYEFAPCGYVTLNPEGIITRCNLTCIGLLGAERTRIRAMGFSGFVAPEWRDHFWRALKQAGKSGEKQSVELRLTGANDESLWVLADIQANRNESGEVSQWRLALVDRTEQKRVDESFRESRERIATLFNATPDSVILLDLDCRILAINEHGAARRNMRQVELIGRPLCDLLPSEIAKERRARIAEILRTGQSMAFEEKRGDKEYALRMCPVLDQNGRVTQIASFSRDITDHKRAENALRESEDQYRTLFENMVQGGFYQLADGSLVDPNAAALEIIGLPREEFLGRSSFNPAWDVIHEDGSPFPGEEHPSIAALKTGRTISNVVAGIYNRKNRGRRWVVINAIPQFRDGKMSPYRVFVTLQDITERKRAEGITRARLQLLEFAVSHTMDELLTRTLDEVEILTESAIGFFHFLEADQKTLSLQNWSTNTLKTMCTASGKGSHYDVEAAGVWADCVRERRPLMHNDYMSLPHRKGLPEAHAPIIREIVCPIFRGDSIVAVLGVGNKSSEYVENDIAILSQLGDLSWDIIERKRAEEALRESERRYKMVADYTHDWEYWIRPDGSFVYVSPSCERITGYSVEEFLGNPSLVEAIAHPEDREWILSHMREGCCPGDEFCQKEYRIITREGDTRWISHYCRSIKDEAGSYLGRRASNRDVSDRVRAKEDKEKVEAQLRHALKLEAIGNLAGGIAHDFNNILSPIIGYTEMAMDGVEESSPSWFDLEQVLAAAKRAKELVKQILSFSRIGEEQLMRPVEASQIVEEALKLLRASLPSTIEIRENIHKVTVVGDATQIHQVVVNLCTNAAHAVEDIGVLDVSLLQVDLSAQDLVNLLIADLRPGKHLKLSVKDTGTGMSSDTMQRIFDPYFTTKEMGKGTGLGLAVVHGIVKRHGGEILVRSEIGRGTTFDVFIPAVRTNLEHETLGSQVLPKGSERILLVDDESAIAAMGARMLEPLGYKVTAMTNPKEALDLFNAQPGQFDLIITDYTMPQMVGTQLADECRRIRAEIPVIICTGHSERLNREEPDRVGVKAIAMKPLDRKQLATLVRDVLDEAKG